MSEDTFFESLAICVFHVRNSSVSTPKHLLQSTLFKEIPFIDACIFSDIMATLCLEATNINSISCIQCLSVGNQPVSRHWISTLICSWSSGILQGVKVNLVSSMYILRVAKCFMLEKSLMYIKNSNGPSIKPWGTPHLICSCLESNPMVKTAWDLFKPFKGLSANSHIL